MALVNPNIAMGVQPLQLTDPLAQYGRIAQLQSAQNQNALAQYQLGAAKRGEETQNVLAQAYAQSVDPATGKIDYNKLTGLVAGGGGGAQLPAIQKSRLEYETAQTTQQKAQSDLLDAKLKQSRGFLDTLDPADPTAPAKYLAWHEANHKDPIIGPALEARGVTADQSRARIAQAIEAGPTEFAKLLNQSKLGTEKFMEMNKPITSVGPTGIVQTPGLGGAATVVPGTGAAFQMTPAQIAANKIAQQQLGVSQGQLGVAQQRVGLERERVGIARTEAERKMQGLEALPPKEIQKREAAFPQATSAVKGFETKTDTFVKDLEKLRDHPGLSQITGIAAGRLPALTADGRAAQALYDKVVAKGGFQALQDLRDASKTGGALGNVSNQEGKQLTASFSAIDRRQDAPDVRAAIDQAIGDVQGAKVRTREAYDATYAYKTPAAAGAPAAAVPAAAPNVVVTPDGQSHTFPTPAAAAQFKKAAGIQ